jgi:hypothetical protein
MASRSPLVLVGGVLKEIPSGDTLPTAVISPLTMTWAGVHTFDNRVTFGASVGGAAGSIYYNSSSGLTLTAKTGSTYDFSITNPVGGTILAVPTGTGSLMGIFHNTGLSMRDSGGTNYLTLVPGSALGGVRTLTLNTGAANRALTLTGDATLNQDVSTAGSPSFVNLIATGDFTLSGTGKFILGDFSGTVANRPMFKTSTVNGATYLGLKPDGTGTSGGFNIFGLSDVTTNTFRLGLTADSASAAIINVLAQGTATVRPLWLQVQSTTIAALSSTGIVVTGSVQVTSGSGTFGWGGGTYYSGASGSNIFGVVNSATITTTSSTGFSVAGVLGSTGNISSGPGGTGAGSVNLALNGGSASGGGGYTVFMRNSVAKSYIGGDSVIFGNNNDDLAIYSPSNTIKLYAGSATPVAVVANTGFAVTGTHTVSGGFGCNGAAAQTPYASGGLLAGVVSALVANGILSN